MRKLLSVIVVLAACGSLLISCNEKPKNYRFVKVMADGQELEEKIVANNDTDALKQYLAEMEKVIVMNIDNPDAKPFEAMYVISPSGDTLNKDNEMIEKVMKSQAGVATIVSPTVPVEGAPAQEQPQETPAPAK